MDILNKLNKLIWRWKEVLLITLVIKALLVIFSFIFHPNANLSDIWSVWDDVWYLEIAKDGYTGENSSLVIVFFPLYPITIKLFSILFGNFEISAIISSIIFSTSASIALFELTSLDFSKRVALLSVWFMNIFPTAYFLQAPYTESLFLTTSLLTIYFFRKKLFVPASILGFLATLTRVNGLTLLPFLFIEQRINRQNLITYLILPLGFLIYLCINYFVFGDPLFFRKPLYTNWSQKLAWPWSGAYYLMGAQLPIGSADFYIYFSELITVVLILFFGIYCFFKIRKSYGVYILFNLLLMMSTYVVRSTPRYALVLFPIFIALGTIKNKLIIAFSSILSMLLLLYFTYLYTHEKWAF